MNDYVRAVAKAYGESDPDFHTIAKRQLDAIKAAKDTLDNQAYTIRQLVALAPAPNPQPVEMETGLLKILTDSAVATASLTASLTDQQKQMAREIWTAEVRQSGKHLSAQEIVDLMRARGVVFGVAQPAAAIGQTLAAARRARDKAVRSRYPEVDEKSERTS